MLTVKKAKSVIEYVYLGQGSPLSARIRSSRGDTLKKSFKQPSKMNRGAE